MIYFSELVHLLKNPTGKELGAMERASHKTTDPLFMPIGDEQYSLVEAHRQCQDTLLWQTPVVSFTAQAFLLTIALGPDTGLMPRIVSALLATVAAFASVQLIAKHRYLEVLDSALLAEYERLPGEKRFAPIHSLGFARQRMRPSWLASISSYQLWVVLLSVSGLVALGVAVCAIAVPSLFQSPKP